MGREHEKEEDEEADFLPNGNFNISSVVMTYRNQPAQLVGMDLLQASSTVSRFCAPPRKSSDTISDTNKTDQKCESPPTKLSQICYEMRSLTPFDEHRPNPRSGKFKGGTCRGKMTRNFTDSKEVLNVSQRAKTESMSKIFSDCVQLSDLGGSKLMLLFRLPVPKFFEPHTIGIMIAI